MAARKDPEDRVRRNRPGYVNPNLPKKVKIELPDWDGVIRGPELPDDHSWTPETLKWWESWRCSPQAMLCSDVDWSSLKVAAIIHNRIQLGCSNTALANLSGELRKREGMFGATPEDRHRLGMDLNTPAKEEIEEQNIQEAVDRTVDYFERVNQALGGGNESSR